MNKKERAFVETVWDYYRANGRAHLPWRKTTDPYSICVSELMLQQTQVERVIPKYEVFLKRWPSAAYLASASLGDVLKAWQGLGYNRRAKYLHLCAKKVVKDHAGVFPTTYESLLTLPGIGPYTAGAIMAFAYDEPVALIETNIRTVFLYHFFKNEIDITDQEIMPLIEKTVSNDSPREWYAALMDYGSHLKQTVGNLNSKSKTYTKQSKFAGSDRQIRGAIIRLLTKSPMSKNELRLKLNEFELVRITEQLRKLQKDKLLVRNGDKYRLP